MTWTLSRPVDLFPKQIAGAFLEAAKLFGYSNIDLNGATQTGNLSTNRLINGH